MGYAEKNKYKGKMQYEQILTSHLGIDDPKSKFYNKIIDIWTHATNDVSNVLYERLKVDNDGSFLKYTVYENKEIVQIKMGYKLNKLMFLPNCAWSRAKFTLNSLFRHLFAFYF